PGRNEIAVELSTDRHDGGLVNPLYLAGQFGVKLNQAPHPPTLTPPAEQGSFAAWEENGMPYYAGVVEYTGEFTLTEAELGLLVQRPGSPHGRPGGSPAGAPLESSGGAFLG